MPTLRAVALLVMPLLSLPLGCAGDDGEDGGNGSEDSTTSGGTMTGPGMTTAADSTVGPDETTVADTTDTTDSASTTHTTDTTDSASTTDTTDTTDTTGDSDSTGLPGSPEIEVSIDGVVVESGATVALPDVVDVGAMGAAVTVTIDNVGDGDLSLMDVMSAGPDSAQLTIDQAGLAAVVEPGEGTSFDVALAPSTGGSKSITLTLDNNDTDESPFELTITGHTTPNAYRNLMPVSAPEPRFNPAMAYAGEDRVVLFGGRLNTGMRVGDTWRFDVETNTWTNAAPAAPTPAARDASQLVHLGDGQLLLFGGNTSPISDAAAVGDTWLYDTDANTWTQLMIAGPPARFQHMMVGLDGGALLFGGRTGLAGTDVGDTWVFNGLAQVWSNAAPTGAPSARTSAAMAWNGGDIVTLYGGFDSTTPISTSFNYSIVGNAWTATGLVANPGARAVLEGEYLDAGRMLVFSGKLGSCCQNPAGGTFAYDPDAGQWAAVAAVDEPAPRYNYGMAAVVGRNKAIVFGGQTLNGGPGSAVSETYELVGPLPDAG